MRDALKNTLLFLFAKLEILSYITIYENVATQRIIFICIDIQNFLLHMYRYMNFIYVHIRQFAFHMSWYMQQYAMICCSIFICVDIWNFICIHIWWYFIYVHLCNIFRLGEIKKASRSKTSARHASAFGEASHINPNINPWVPVGVCWAWPPHWLVIGRRIPKSTNAIYLFLEVKNSQGIIDSKRLKFSQGIIAVRTIWAVDWIAYHQNHPRVILSYFSAITSR